MAYVPNDPKLLRRRAGEARILAKNTLDLGLRAQMFEIASMYERLAEDAEKKEPGFQRIAWFGRAARMRGRR